MSVAGFFSLPQGEYKRKIDPVQAYVEQSAFYIAKKTGVPLEEAVEYIKGEIASGRIDLYKVKAPRLARDKNGDRRKDMTTMYHFIQDVVQDNLLITPSMTCYLRPDQKPSLLAAYIKQNVMKRSAAKKLMFKYEMAQNYEEASIADNAQNSFKIKNNALSGTQAVKSTVLYNRSAHSSLTSVCRSITSVSNANNEKFLRGNRHYWSPEITLYNLIALANDAKHHRLQEAIDRYNLHVPTVNDVVECVTYSSQNYWSNWNETKRLKEFIQTLSDTERAFIVYGGDFYHLAKHNEDFVRTLLSRMVHLEQIEHPDPASVYKKVNEDVIVMGALLAGDMTRGVQIASIIKPDQNGVYKHPTLNALLAGNCDQLHSILMEYETLFTAFYRPNLLPATAGDVPDMYRKAVPVSDTDSSIFTTMWWGKFMTGEYSCDEVSTKTCYVITYFITQTVVHLLAMLSKNFGIGDDLIHDFTMKNEYAFPVFLLSSLAKHYLAMITAKEGNLLPKVKFERKGVNLRNSAASVDIVNKLHQMADDIMVKIYQGEKLDLQALLHEIAMLEKQIYDDVRSGSPTFLRSIQVKDEESYSLKDNAPAVKQHQLWENVFAYKYGSAPELPYKSVTITLQSDSPTKLTKWIDSIEDKVLADKLRNYTMRHFPNGLPTIRLPIAVVSETGIPVELLDQSKFREVVKAIVTPFYIVLASLGLPLLGDKGRYLLSDDQINGFEGVV